MAKIGGRRKLVRLEIAWAPAKKVARFVTAPRGAHPLERSLPLLLVIRDKLKLAETAREARRIIKGRQVKVDGKVCSDHRHGLGLFDTLEVAGSAYRLVPAKSGFKLAEIKADEARKKLCKITGKSVVRAGKIQLALHDGRSIIVDKTESKVGDSLLLGLPEQKMEDTYKLEQGSLVLVTRGLNMGRVAKIRTIEHGLFPRAWLSADNATFEAPLSAVMPVGKDRAVITVA
jgi:small subunit ribosomal protein S4e